MVQKCTNWFILEPILFGEKFHLRDISRKVGIPHSTVRRYLQEWLKKGVVKKKKRGNQIYYSINQDHPSIIDIVSLVEKERVYKYTENNLLSRELIAYLHKMNASLMIIFGSSVEDIDKAEDVDILIMGKINQRVKEDIERKLGLRLHIVRAKYLKNISTTLKKEIINKHLIIEGVEKCVKWMLEN